MYTTDTLLEIIKGYKEMAEKVVEVADKVDRVNKKLIILCSVITISLCLTIILMAGFYFLGDYQYPTTSQEVTSSSIKQEVR